MNILLSFTHLPVVPNEYNLLSSVKHERRYFEEWRKRYIYNSQYIIFVPQKKEIHRIWNDMNFVYNFICNPLYVNCSPELFKIVFLHQYLMYQHIWRKYLDPLYNNLEYFKFSMLTHISQVFFYGQTRVKWILLICTLLLATPPNTHAVRVSGDAWKRTFHVSCLETELIHSLTRSHATGCLVALFTASQ